ncbi:MAG: trypsin-like peptidase domain-containing protein [Patescibacteria group bacterium]|jgi:serine protease Do
MRKGLDVFLIIVVSTILGGLFGSYLIVNNLSNLPWAKGNNFENAIKQQVLRQEETSVTDVVKRVSPAVVSIEIQKDISKNVSVDPFGDFFGNWPFFGQQPASPKTTEPDWQKVGGGTGFIISSDGLIMTNRHVIEDTTAKYKVILNDGRRFDAEIVGTDLFNDIGVLKIAASGLPMVEFGDSDQLVIGQSVVAIGNALAEFSNTVTVGVVSGIGRSIVAGTGGSSEKLANVIQTDAAINPGNSGGPLLNLSGQVIGINTAISSQGQLIGFAIPINSVRQIIDSVKKTGEIIRPYLGVRYTMLDEDTAKKLKLDITEGALLAPGSTATDTAVLPNSPASKAGLQANDVITEVNGKKLSKDYDLAQAISQFQPNDKINLKVWTKGQTKDVAVTLERYKKP